MIVEANPDIRVNRIGVTRTLGNDLQQGVLLDEGECAGILRYGAAPCLSDSGKNFLSQLRFKGMRVFIAGVDDQAVEVPSLM